MRAMLAIASGIGVVAATSGAAAVVAVCLVLGTPNLVTCLAGIGGGLLAGGLVGGIAALVLPVTRPIDTGPIAVAVRDLVAGRLEEVRLPDQGPDDLLGAVRDLAAKLSEDRKGTVARETELRDSANKHVSSAAKLQMQILHLERKFKSSIDVRDAFLARMSHELRTPLNAILGYVELLMDEASGDARHDLERVRFAAMNLLAIVTTVLDLTQLQAGSYDIRPEPILVADLVKQVVESVRLGADANGNRLDVVVDPALDARLDRRMVQSVLFNLASNACKYTANGVVTLSARRVEQRIVLEVRDTGIGMTQRQIDEAGRPFWQADDSATRKYDGAGLGLAVVRGFAEAMGGVMKIHSTLGKGATVVVNLPDQVDPKLSSFDDDSPTMLLR